MDDWRALHELARHDVQLRDRLANLVTRLPLPLPRFWLALFADLGIRMDFDAELPDCGGDGVWDPVATPLRLQPMPKGQTRSGRGASSGATRRV